MRLLREIYDSDIWLQNDFKMKYKIRKAARVVLEREWLKDSFAVCWELRLS